MTTRPAPTIQARSYTPGLSGETRGRYDLEQGDYVGRDVTNVIFTEPRVMPTFTDSEILELMKQRPEAQAYTMPIEIESPLRWWEVIEEYHVKFFFYAYLLLVIGLLDLGLLAFGLRPVLHWANDALLIAGSLSLHVTLLIMLVDRARE